MRYFVAAVAIAIAPPALAGPEWPEAGDAGSLPSGAQTTTGVGPLGKITGNLEGPPGFPGRGLGDFQDMYLINIVDPILFSASTVGADGGLAAFDSQLWLFNLDGTGLLANMNAGPGEEGARLISQSNDGSGAMLTIPGFYYLAISGAGSVPLGGPGPNPMFDFGPVPGEISGPDGPGGFGNPIADWTNPGQFGHYEIILTGVELIVPAPAAPLVLSGIALFARRRRA